MTLVSPRAKGASGELELARLLTRWALDVGIDLNMVRNLEQTRSGGHDLLGCPGLAIECKRVETLDVNGWWRQCVRQATEAGLQPLLCYRQNRKSWFFVTEEWLWPCTTRKIVVSMDELNGEVWFKAYMTRWLETRQQS